MVMKMDEAAILIPASAVRGFDEPVRKAILDYLAGSVGAVSDEVSASAMIEEPGLARLTESEAQSFLNNCSEKTIKVLRVIVQHDGRFLMSDVAMALGVTPPELRAAWAGLTKRVRTITKDPQSKLINWTRRGSDWHGELAHLTVRSMGLALAEQS